MKTFDKIWIFIGFFLIFMIVGYIIYDVTYLQKTTPKIYHIEYQYNTKDAVLVSFNCNYSAILGNDPYKDDRYKNKEMCIIFLSTDATHEIFQDLCLADYLQKKDEILYDINKAFTAKVLQRFPDIEFQIIDIEIIIKL